jgi:hypothetical protein
VAMSAAASCVGGCQCRAAAKGPASAIAALRMARSLALPPAAALFAAGLGRAPAPAQRLKLARWPLQLGVARVASNGAFFQTNSSSPRRQRNLAVVNKLSPLQGSTWLNGQGSSLWQLQAIPQSPHLSLFFNPPSIARLSPRAVKTALPTLI